jgi:hypothetical protein
MHELYLWPFANAVRAGTASVMCSYQRINGSYGCQNSKTLNGLLKGELGFQGFVMSDWLAVHAGVASIQAGLVSAVLFSVRSMRILMGRGHEHAWKHRFFQIWVFFLWREHHQRCVSQGSHLLPSSRSQPQGTTGLYP